MVKTPEVIKFKTMIFFENVFSTITFDLGKIRRRCLHHHVSRLLLRRKNV